ncbi:MAG: NTP transferase domain-containing protein [Clostridiales bacterium]|nr:NTP transferase domain-containing protein [Clostridiales bacterium]
MKTIILAGGKGKRLMSENHEMPKAMREVNNRPMIDYVIENTSFSDEIILVVGYKKEAIIEHTQKKYTYVYQKEQLGTGHATLCAYPALNDYKGPVLLTFGDMPLFTKATYQKMFETHGKEKADCTILTATVDGDNPLPKYGRIIRDSQGDVIKVVEDKDCNNEEELIRELNVGVMVCDSEKLFTCLKQVGNSNKQNEYYLTEVPEIMKKNNFKVITYQLFKSDEIYGANTIEELLLVEKVLKERE